MVFRKPYAFIIKHFKIIHLSMLACLVFFLLTINDIRNLLGNLQKTNTLMYSGADVYINKFIFVFIFLMLIVTGIVYWLLRQKKKPTILYLALLIYLGLLIPLYSYLFSILNNLIENIVTIDTIILAKDISFIATIPCYVFIVFTFIRGIGFNLKQFNFKKDLKELQVQDEDNAEVELNFGQNNYIYMRYIRRSIREIKYYIIENRFVISLFGIAILIALGFMGFKYYNNYIKTMKASEATSVNGITYTVINSYLTSNDSTGSEVDPNYKYVIVYMTFHNSYDYNRPIDLDLITLANGNKLYYHPKQTLNNKFFDIGPSYVRGEMLGPGETRNATLTFEIPKNAKLNDLVLRVRYAIENTNTGIASKYRKFNINPIKLDKKTNNINIKQNQLMNINPVGVNKFDLKITGYKVLDVYDNKYILCTSLSKCSAQSDVITPDSKDTNTMLMLSFNSKIYEDNRFIKTLNTYNKIFGNYLTVKYNINGKEYEETGKMISKSDVDDKVFVIVNRRINKANKISVELNFRNDKYIIPLKEG